MAERLVVTLFAAVFLAVLAGTRLTLRRRNIDMGGTAPINPVVFASSKYLMALLWAAMVARAWGAPLSVVAVPPAVRIVAVFLWALGFALALAGRLGLGNSFRVGSASEPTALRTGGLYAFSRNPMYVGAYATLVAAAAYTANPLALAGAAYVVAVHHVIVRAEEAHLRGLWGDQYLDYCRRVRRYL